MTILIINPEAERYAARIRLARPDVTCVAVPDRDAALGQAAQADAMIGFNGLFDGALLRAAGNLRWIQSLSTGTERIQSLRHLVPGLIVTSMRGIHGPMVSEMAFLHMLALARDFRGIERNRSAAAWIKPPQRLLYGKVLAIVGLGTIAEELARRAVAFGMRVIGVSRQRRAVPCVSEVLPYEAVADAAGRADFMVLLAPLTDMTRHLIDEGVIATMKPGAFLINLARGGICDEAALGTALAEGRLGGAGADVFEQEPLPPDHPLWREDGLLVTPHVAGMADSYPDLALPIILENLEAFLNHRPERMRNLVGP